VAVDRLSWRGQGRFRAARTAVAEALSPRGLQPGDDTVDVCDWTVLAQFRLGFHPPDHDLDTHDRAQLSGDELRWRVLGCPVCYGS
jgi:hypothetical protein